MGFFDKLKSAANFVTGGGAKVSVDVIGATTQGPFDVCVRVTEVTANMNIDAVYVLVRSTEEVDVDGDKVARELQENSKSTNPADPVQATRVGRLTDEEQTSYQRVTIAGAQALVAGQTYEWTGQVTLPSDALPTYRGRSARHTWYIQAGLDKTGNDPDSGWVDFRVRDHA